MPSEYPGALDALPTNKTNDTTAKDDHAANHNDANAAVNAVQETLGVNPQGDAQDIAERLDATTAFVSATSHGAVGDSVADDTEALQTAIDRAIELGRPLYLPPGEYKTTEGLVANTDFFAIFGAGARESVIVPAASTYHALSIGTGEGPNNGPSGYARDFGIAGGNAEVAKAGAGKDTGKAALHLNSVALFEVSNVRVSGDHDIANAAEDDIWIEV